ncbi:MAG: hypothetical protein ABSG41_28955 [Bryobacteraceae bacterium]
MNTVKTASEKHSVWSLYPVPLFALLVVLLLYLFLFPPVTITLDGYSHLYGGEALRLMLAGQPEVHNTFSYNSVLVPNWLSTLILVALSSIVSGELALKLLIVLIGTALVSSVYFCIDASQYHRHQRAQVLIVLLPFALNAYLTLGFYGFLISSSMCIFVLGLVLRYGLRMPLRFQCVTACLLLVAYFSHPVPVIISFLFPFACFIADAVIHWRDGWRHSTAAVKRHAFDIWPWLPPACILPWFYVRLSRASALPGTELHADSTTFPLIQRIEALARDAFLYISPTANVGTLFIALLSVLLAGVFLCRRKLFMQNPLRSTILTVLIVSTMALSLMVPDHVGNGSDIVSRFWLHSTIFLVLLALASGVFDAQLLTVCSLLAALSVIGFAGEYLLVSKRLAPEVAELRIATESVPRHSRILIMGYRMTPPSCPGLPLVKMTVPERHWALVGALKNELIVLNDYEAATSHFPLKYSTPRYAGVINEVDSSGDEADLSGEKKRAAWVEILKSDPDVDFVLSWGISRAPNCMNSVYPPFEELLKNRYDRVFFKQDSSRVELWRKRG